MHPFARFKRGHLHLTRVEAFSDGVFAIVVTLLVLELKLPPLKDHANLILIHRTEAQGMRPAINSAAAIARGKYLMKTDAHCMFERGFDEVLAAECDDNWVVIPRRVSLDAENWAIKKTGKAPVDYHFLCYPYFHPNEPGIHGLVWNERARARLDIPLDDEMSSQ